jgi:hypothetical protein
MAIGRIASLGWLSSRVTDVPNHARIVNGQLLFPNCYLLYSTPPSPLEFLFSHKLIPAVSLGKIARR